MMIKTNSETAGEIKKIMEANADQPKNVRIYVAGMACSGPNFGLALDELKDEDASFEFEGVNFIMDKEIYGQFGDFNVEFVGGGYRVVPVNQPESACGSCAGSCAE